METSSQLHDEIHLKILPTLLQLFLRYFSYCRRKAFNEAYDKINEFSNFKYNLVSRFNNLQDTAIELGSKNTFWRTWNSLLNLIKALICNIQFNWFFSLCNASDWILKIQIFQLANMVNHPGLHLSNVLRKYFILNLFFCIWSTSSQQILLIYH